MPYDVKVKFIVNEVSAIEEKFIYNIDGEYSYITDGKSYLTLDIIKALFNNHLDEIKPYLFPLSSMTEEQLYEVSQILGKDVAISTDYLLTIDHRRRTFSYQELDALFNWFDKNHFDYRGLIPMGLAIDATGLNIY